MKRKRQEDKGDKSPKRSKVKVTQVWDRDIVCLPPSSKSKFPYPRGKYRTKLGEKGLIGKVRLASTMSVSDVENEVCSVFHVAMGGNEDFNFNFLQPTGAGSKTLTVPAVSSTFEWTAQQVAKLGSNKQAIYIIANDPLACSLESEVCYAQVILCNKPCVILCNKPYSSHVNVCFL